MSRNAGQSNQDGYAYNAYLVRLWQDTRGAPWRASARSVMSGETVHFASVAALCAFLNAHAGPTASGEDRPALPADGRPDREGGDADG